FPTVVAAVHRDFEIELVIKMPVVCGHKSRDRRERLDCINNFATALFLFWHGDSLADREFTRTLVPTQNAKANRGQSPGDGWPVVGLRGSPGFTCAQGPIALVLGAKRRSAGFA